MMKPFDTVYVQAGLNKSNRVTVYIYNLPPRITGLKVGDSSFNVPSHITDIVRYNYVISDTIDTIIPINLTVIDPDKNFNISWGIYSEDGTPDIDKYLIYSGTAARYILRDGNLRDIVSTLINDGDKQIHIEVNMIRLDGRDVIIDSITFRDGINDTAFKDTSAAIYSMSVIRLNTGAIRAFPRLSGGTASWSARKGTITYNLGLDSSGCAVTYICTLSTVNDTLVTDTKPLLDSIRFVYRNEHEDDSTVKVIKIYKKSPNKHPVIDSILIHTDIRKTNYHDTIAAGSTIPLKAYATDPEGGNVAFTWQGDLIGSLYNATGDSNSYTAAVAGYIDTITVIASDSLGFKDTQTIILSTNVLPLIDSIKIDTVMYKNGFVHVVNADSIITIKAFAHDPEGGASGGTISFRWQGTLTGAVSSTIENPITYTAASGAYSDTLYLVAADSLGFTDIQLMILPCNNPPVVDSISAGASVKVPVSPDDTVFSVSKAAPGSFLAKVVAHDMDTAIHDDVASYLWQYKDANLNSATSTSSSFMYAGADTTYVDTVSLTIRDKFNTVTRQKMIITFTK
jgi:hypothetical protein